MQILSAFAPKVPTPVPVTLNANRGIYVQGNGTTVGGCIENQGGVTMVIPGVISGTGPFFSGANATTGDGIVIVSGQNTYTGPTIISAGWLEIGANNSLPAGTPMTICSSAENPIYGAFFQNNGYDQTIGPLQSSPGNGGTGVGVPAVELSGGAALTILETNANTSFSGCIGYNGDNNGSLIITVPRSGMGSTLTLYNSNNYTGNTTITMAPGAISGPTLALANNPSPPSYLNLGYGAINSTANISIGAGGTFDVSLLPSSAYTLSTSTMLSASGTGTSQGTTAATINGASGGTINLGSQAISLTYGGSGPALYISQGTLVLNGNPITVVNTASPLVAGIYLLIQQQNSGGITSSGTYLVNVSGNGLATGTTASIQVTGQYMYLVVVDISAYTWDPQGPSGPPTSGSWESSDSNSLENGQGTQGAWVEGSSALFAVNSTPSTPPFTVTLSSSHTVAGIFNGSLTNGPCIVGLSGSGITDNGLLFATTSPGTTSVTNTISGSGVVTVQGTGQVYLYGTNTYGGPTLIAGSLTIGGKGNLGNAAY